MITAMLQSLAPLRTTCGCINCPVPRIECRPGEGIRRRDWFAGAHVLGLGTARDDHLVTLSDNSPWSGLLPIASHIEDGELCDILKALCRWGGGGWGGFFIPQSLFLPSVSKSLSHTILRIWSAKRGGDTTISTTPPSPKPIPLICIFLGQRVRCFMFKTNILSTFCPYSVLLVHQQLWLSDVIKPPGMGCNLTIYLRPKK